MAPATSSPVVDLVGRDVELAAVTRAVADVRGGAGAALGVLGVAGIGKTGLLSALAEQADAAGLVVFDGRGAEHERDVPFGVVVDALGEHAPLTEATTAAERFRHHRAVRDLLERLAREHPLALVLDDLHWADEATLELVLHLLRRPRPCLLAFALRPACAPTGCSRSRAGRTCRWGR